MKNLIKKIREVMCKHNYSYTGTVRYNAFRPYYELKCKKCGKVRHFNHPYSHVK